MKLVSALFPLFLVFGLLSAATPFPGEWKSECRGAGGVPRQTDGNAILNASFPGGALLYKERQRFLFAPDRAAFEAGSLSIDVKADGIRTPLKAWIFVKDKDGAWFQSGEEFSLKPGEWTRLSVRLDRSGQDLFPQGHHAAWSGFFASRIFAAGVSLYSDSEQNGTITMRPPQLEGKRESVRFPHPLDWRLPERGVKYERILSRFQLDKEYFNPFNPDEIAVDFEVITPSAPDTIQTWPAFFSFDCLRQFHFTAERVSLQGLPFWEFRYIPKEKGVYKFRLRMTDSTDPNHTGTVFSEWRTVPVEDSDHPGFIRVSRRNPRYFEYDNGDFYFPVGINIHSNTDQRSERACRFPHLPDRGNVDYEEYIQRCSENGVNLIEVWMASWTYAIEWSSSRNGFYGLGHYNMQTAWKLDLLLDFARKHGVYINLVLDNHGKVADICDPEWYDSPYNAKGIFAKANGGFLSSAEEFWSNPRAIEYARKRNRYIAARWGADPAIFALEQWSEVDLVASAWKVRKDMIKWHKMTANDIKQTTQAPFLTATHICGEIGNLMGWKDLAIDPPELTHVCCDAYRNARIPIVNQMQLHQDRIASVLKPVLITEYGGTNAAGGWSQLKADIHGGVWAALFTRHAGTPLLWWHDFIHINNEYAHFKGFSNYLKGIDLTKGQLEYGILSVSSRPMVHPQPFLQPLRESLPGRIQKLFFPRPELSGLFLKQDQKILYGWFYNVSELKNYRNEQMEVPLSRRIVLYPKTSLAKGLYLVRWFDTMSGEAVSSSFLDYSAGGKLHIKAPDIRLDLAFKVFPVGEGGK